MTTVVAQNSGLIFDGLDLGALSGAKITFALNPYVFLYHDPIVEQFYGSFTYSIYPLGLNSGIKEIESGIIQGWKREVGGQILFDISNFQISIATLKTWVSNNSNEIARQTIMSGADSIQGSAFTDQLKGYNGADTIVGGAGDDTIDGGGGADVLSGGAGGDVFYLSSAAPGADRILDFNLAQGDRVLVDPGATYSIAQSGADTILTLSGVGQVTLVGVASNTLTGAWISTTAGSAPPSGGGAASSVFSFGSISPSAALTLGPGDKISLPATATQATVLYGADGITVSIGGKFVVFGLGISAMSKAGNITTSDGAALYIGLGDADAFTGGAGADAAFGGLGDDTLNGGLGGDLLQGNQGADRLIGGDGGDTVYGGQDNDTLLLDAGANFGQGNRGNDSIAGGDGADTLLGGQDNDTLSGAGGADFFNGNRGDDSISGGAGADTLLGESGADTLSGGVGADVFRGSADSGLDRVTDFNRAEGDQVVLDPGTAYAANQVGADVVISFGGANQIVLVGTSMATLTGSWIVA